MVKNETYTYIDLFAGAAGLSEGFSRAGFIPVAHVEMNEDATNTIKTRLAYHYLQETNQGQIYNDYLSGKITRETLYNNIPKELLASVLCEKISDESLPSIFERIDKLIKKQEVTLIIGGPPCQAYSLVGRSIKSAQDKEKIKNFQEVVEDPRNYLYKLYCEFLKKYKPKMFVFENVAGLLTAQNGKHFEDFKKLATACGYTVDHKVLRAEEYGVLQSRRRVIVIGWRNDLKLSYPEIEKNYLKGIVNDLLADLPNMNPGETKNQYATKEMSNYLATTKIRKTNDVLTWHVCRPHIDRDREIYRTAIKMWGSGKKRLKYDMLPDELKTHKNRKSFLDRFKVVAGDTGTCHTMMAHISKDGHYFIHPDIKQARSISVREAARIQSFPDDYFFEGSRTSAFTQIGNAVPPLMAEQIARAIYKLLQTKEKAETNE